MCTYIKDFLHMQLICILVPSSLQCRLMLPVHSTFQLVELSLSILLPSVSRRQTDFLLLDLLLLFNIITFPIFLLHTMLLRLLFPSSAVLHLPRTSSKSGVSTYPHPGCMWPFKMCLLLSQWDETNLWSDTASKISFLTSRIFRFSDFVECSYFWEADNG